MVLVGANVSGGHLWSIKFMQQTYRTIIVFQAVLGVEARERGKTYVDRTLRTCSLDSSHYKEVPAPGAQDRTPASPGAPMLQSPL